MTFRYDKLTISSGVVRFLVAGLSMALQGKSPGVAVADTTELWKRTIADIETEEEMDMENEPPGEIG
jgi:hypothetical protein